MPKFLKDKKVIIYRSQESTGPEAGGTVYKPIHSGTLWAYVRQTSGEEFYRAGMVQNVEDMIFKVNWRSDIEPTMYVKYKDRFYNIVRVDSFEGYKENLTLYCTLLARSAQPTPGEIVSY